MGEIEKRVQEIRDQQAQSAAAAKQIAAENRRNAVNKPKRKPEFSYKERRQAELKGINDKEYDALNDLYQKVILPGYREIRGNKTMWFFSTLGMVPVSLEEGKVEISEHRIKPSIICNYGPFLSPRPLGHSDHFSLLGKGKRMKITCGEDDGFTVEHQEPYPSSKTEHWRDGIKRSAAGWRTKKSENVAADKIDDFMKDRIANVYIENEKSASWRYGMVASAGLAALFLFKACSGKANAAEAPQVPDQDQPVVQQMNLEP